ncbi:MAG: bifunctional UDP-N-acetylglucosamine diphosphorylase/glucosamine-1-phosphate N-acetyltransferase GlmU [Sulfuricella sp.]|nr:bifunctional UDP-N-acetylglucosamine diphosphorylase/glucosamine-1-phosphate N-acetyltransferase GlmU [Sulfuricella sp.]
MNFPLDIVILAAGKGTRMVSDLPKVLHKLAGRPLLQHVIDSAHALGARKIAVVYGHGGEIVPQRIADPAIAWVKQEPQLGTGHAVQQAAPHLPDDGLTLVLYGDVPLISLTTLQGLVAAANNHAAALLTVDLPDPSGYGRIQRDAAGHICAIVEHKDATEEQRAINEVNTGVMVLPSARLKGWLAQLSNNNAQGEYYLTDVIAMAVADGVPVHARQSRHHWEVLGINSPTQLAHLERLHQHEEAMALLEKGVRLADPKRFDVRGTLTCGRDVEIDIDCIFEGQVTLGDNVSIGAHSILRDVTVANGTQIAPFSLIEKAEVGADCRIGPFARIRPGTVLAADAHIGNFVEIKNSQVGTGSKINHLSYVGDATVGAKVNVGAGTITCNYDGANKYRTVIGDGAFIGSDTQLVAPVTVGENATIGAGSTITKDTPAGGLTLSRAKQLTLPGWKRPVKR